MIGKAIQQIVDTMRETDATQRDSEHDTMSPM